MLPRVSFATLTLPWAMISLGFQPAAWPLLNRSTQKNPLSRTRYNVSFAFFSNHPITGLVGL